MLNSGQMEADVTEGTNSRTIDVGKLRVLV